MSKTTPGPWTAVIGETAVIRDAQGNQLAMFTHMNTRSGGRRDADEVAGNARLAAAAHDLLDALQDALQYLERHLPDEALAPHRAAIAKATA